MTMADLGRAPGRIGGAPSSSGFGDSVVHEILPNARALPKMMALGMLDAHGIWHPLDDVEPCTQSIEAMKPAFADLHQYNADIDAMPGEAGCAAEPRLPAQPPR